MAIRSRSVVIAGHPTTLRLERPYWQWLRVIGAVRGLSVSRLIEDIGRNRSPGLNWSAAIRLYVAGYFYGSSPYQDQALIDPHSKLTVLIGPVRNIDRSLQRGRRALQVVDEMDERYGTRRGTRKARPRAA